MVIWLFYGDNNWLRRSLCLWSQGSQAAELNEHHHSQFQNNFHHPKKKPQAISSQSLSPTLQPLAPTHLLCLRICLLGEFLVTGIMQYMAFCNQLLALSIMFVRFIQVVAWSHSFWLSNIPLCGHTTFCLSMSPGFGRGACFHLLAFADSGCYDLS